MLLQPPADLQDWLSAGIAMDFGPADAHVPCRFPALAASAIVVATRGRFGLRDESAFRPLPQAFVSGPSTRPLALHRTSSLQVVSVMVRPQAAAALFGDTPLRLVDRVADAAAVFPKEWDETMDRIAALPTASQRLAQLFAFVRQRARRNGFDAAPRLLRAALAGVREGAGQLGCSTRQLERRFSGAFGLSPKRFQRMARAETAMRELMAGRGRAVEIAADLGYFDQSHLARDLREMGGITAAELMGPAAGCDPSLQPLRIGATYGAAGIRPDFLRSDFVSRFS